MLLHKYLKFDRTIWRTYRANRSQITVSIGIVEIGLHLFLDANSFTIHECKQSCSSLHEKVGVSVSRAIFMCQ